VNTVFYLSAAVAILATLMVITRAHAMHALLYMILSLLAVALIFYTLGAPFVAALEVIVYAGAIMVLFIFAIMVLNQGAQAVNLERRWLASSGWTGPAVLAAVLLAEVVYLLAAASAPTPATPGTPVEPRAVGAALFTTYLIGVELASILLLAGLVGAYHLGRRRQDTRRVITEAVLEAPSSAYVGEKDVKEARPFKPVGDKIPTAETAAEKERE